jgi:hypothetical protein
MAILEAAFELFPLPDMPRIVLAVKEVDDA